MNLRKSLVEMERHLGESMKESRVSLHQKLVYSDIYKFKLKSPPKEVSKAAVNAVWGKYKGANCKWAQYYWSINGIASPYYIPTDIWFSKLCRKLNSLDRFGWPQFQDKNYLDVVFRGVRQPEIIVRNIAGQLLDADFEPLSLKQAVEKCCGEEELFIKPSITSKGGRGVEFIANTGRTETEERLSRAFSEREKDFTVQKAIHQHSKMSALNPDSINSVRVQTLLWNGKVEVLSALVRVGVKGCKIDNPHSSNGVSCVLTEEGKMIRTAYDRDWHPKTVLPNGQASEGFEVPYYSRIIEAVTKLQYQVPHSRLVGWDMTISEEGEPILIEANLDYPEVYFHQLGKGPIISNPGLFDEVMRFVYK